MPSIQQTNAMDYVKQQIASGNGANLNANTNPYASTPNQPLNQSPVNPTKSIQSSPIAPINPTPQTTIPAVQPKPSMQNPSMSLMTQGQQATQQASQQSQIPQQFPPQKLSQSVQNPATQQQPIMPPVPPVSAQNQQSQNQSQSQSSNQSSQQNQPPAQQQNSTMPVDNSNLQVPQGGIVHQSSAGNLVPQTTADDGMIPAINQQTGQPEMASPNDPRWASGALIQNNPSYQIGDSTPTSNVQNALQSMGGQNFDSMLQNANSQGIDQTSADLMKQSLMSQLGAIDDPNITKYLDNMSSRAQGSYAIGLNMVNQGRQEIDQAITGTLTAPSTYEGIQAKIIKDTETQQLDTLSAQKDYQATQQATALDDLQTKRADLEGFMKARMNADGTQDSSAALTVMSQSLHQSDMAIATQNSGYTYAQAMLNIQGTQIMHDFGNNIGQLVTQTNQKQQQITSDYYTQLNGIDQQALTNEKDKRTQTAAAFGSYYKGMTDLRTQQQTRQLDMAKFSWQQTSDTRTYASQISGETGEIYMPDGKGGVTGTGQATYDAQKNQFTQGIDLANLHINQLSASRANMDDVFTQANANGIDVGSKQFADLGNSIDRMLGFPQGTMAAQGSVQGMQDYYNKQANGADSVLQNVASQGTNAQIPQDLKDVFNVGGHGGQCGDFATTISTAPRVGASYQVRMQQVAQAGNIQDDPQPGFKLITPLGMKTDNGVGHVQTVLSYDPKTRNALVVESNRDLKGTISMRTENLDQLHAKFDKQGWGFLPGDLRQGVKQKMAGLGTSQVSVTPPAETPWDQLAASLGNNNGPVSRDQQIWHGTTFGDYISKSTKGNDYINLSNISDPKELAKVQDSARKSGIPVLDKEGVSSINSIDVARQNLNGLTQAMQKLIPKNNWEKPGAIFTETVNNYIHTDGDRDAIKNYQDTASNMVRSLQGATGGKISDDKIQTVLDGIPQTTDTISTVKKKMHILNSQLDSWENEYLKVPDKFKQNNQNSPQSSQGSQSTFNFPISNVSSSNQNILQKYGVQSQSTSSAGSTSFLSRYSIQ